MEGGVLAVKNQSFPQFKSFRAASLSFIGNLMGVDSVYYKEFSNTVFTDSAKFLLSGIQILKEIKEDVKTGWVVKYKEIVSAEIFSDFLEMAEHLLAEGYKDPAAVMIGSVLEEHLRQLCNKNGVEIFILKDGKEVPKKADVINADLKKENVYNLLEQKQITALLDLRNNAAHGKYDQYDATQVKAMYQGVLDFIIRHP